MATEPIGVRFAFDGRNEAAQRAAKHEAANLVTNITRETRRALHALIVRSFRDGIPSRDAARMIRDMVGLNEPQAAAAANYRKELVDSGLPQGRVDALTERYVAKKIRERAETIARTEVMQALNAGTRASWAAAQKEGLLGPRAKKEWIGRPDACEI